MSLAILSKEIKAPGKSLLYLRLYWQIPRPLPKKWYETGSDWKITVLS